LALGACATPPIVINYAPSSTMTVEGAMEVGNFKYLPGEKPEVKPNQIRNTAMGEIVFEKNIDEYFKTALFVESRFVGIKVKKSDTVVSGEINDFLIDDLGYSVDWKLDVHYLVKKNGATEICFDKTKLIEKNTSKFVNVFGSLNEIMKLNVEQLFSDKDFLACIG